MKKEGFWLRVRTYIFQLLIVIGIIMLVGILTPPINVIVTIIAVIILINWNKLFNKKEKEEEERILPLPNQHLHY